MKKTEYHCVGGKGQGSRDSPGRVRLSTQEQGYQFFCVKSISGLGLYLCHPDLSAAGRKASERQDYPALGTPRIAPKSAKLLGALILPSEVEGGTCIWTASFSPGLLFLLIPILPDTPPWGVGPMAPVSLVGGSGTSLPDFEVPASGLFSAS